MRLYHPPVTQPLTVFALSTAQPLSQAAERSSVPRLVAVGKTKPLAHILAAYNAGQRVFGENYVCATVATPPHLRLPPDH